MTAGTWRSTASSSKHASSTASGSFAADLRVGGEHVPQRDALVGGAERGALDDRVRVLA